MINRASIEQHMRTLQDAICSGLESADGKGSFIEQTWQRLGGGGGRTRAIEGEKIVKGGVNFSAVHGQLPAETMQYMKVSSADFFATGVSIVLHPFNPWSPIIHMNVRYFEAGDSWWFGGGIDLSPHYIIPEDARWFHEQLKKVCDKHHPSFYDAYKKWSDEYFFLKHRGEARGVSGIFFDRLNDQNTPLSKEELLAFVMDVGGAFAPIYTELLHRNHTKPYTQTNLDWQAARRSRYVEFNLIWDAGTKFGLETGGRTESILMSMPPVASWVHPTVLEGSPEHFTQQHLTKGIDWLNYSV